MPAIAQGEDVTIEAPLSRKLHEGFTKAAEIWKSWVPGWHRSRVEAQLVDRCDLSPSVVAACFSGGVDSFYTALRPRQEPITTLITLREFASDAQLVRFDRDQALDVVSKAAAALVDRHIVIESNVFSFCGRYSETSKRVFGRAFGGAVLGACVLGLGSLIKRCYVASGFTPGQELVPTGHHPHLDCLWSTEVMETVHDGLVDRDEKIALLSCHEVALEALFVCPQLRSSPGNCRRCDKCIEATFLLTRHGALDRCPTLGPLTPEIMRRTIIRPFRLPAFERFPEMTDDEAMKRAITSALRRSKARRYVRPAGRVLRRMGLR
jgi:hypothetical protein